MNRLLTPLSYLAIKHDVKVWYDVIYPLLFAVPLGCFLAFLPFDYSLVGEQSIVQTFNGLLALLIGFFIAALAAVATFDRKGMDSLMLGGGATLKIPGRDMPIDLTRRMFLCLLFGYLTLITLVAYLVFSIANVVLTHISAHELGITEGQYLAARLGFIYLYCFALGHIMSHSLLGVYYLAWRTIAVDPEIIDDKLTV